MHELRDDYCPFCRSVGTVQFYENATSLYGKLYRCRLCTAVFDARQKEQEERVQMRERKEKLEAIKEAPAVQSKKVPVKRKPLVPKTLFLTVVIIIIIFLYLNN